ncbi:MAG: hypothetical protein Q9190_006670 [Brigantiaea leucoxantha]
MPWRPLPRIAFAVAIYPFSASSPADLPLELGDELYIIERGGAGGEWYRGYLVAPPSLLAGLTGIKGRTLEARVFSGIFPKNCVEVREILDDSRPRGKAYTIGPEGSDSLTNLVNGGSWEKQSSPPHRKSVRRHGSRKESLRAQSPSIFERATKDSGIGSFPSQSSSKRSVDKADHWDLSRKVSHRSIASLRSQESLVPPSPASTTESRRSDIQRPSAPVPMLKIGDETPTLLSEPLVDEIASCLREWHSKNLHELLLSRRYAVLDRLSSLVQRLELSRRQLLHGVLTTKELESSREGIVWDLVNGNKLLSGEVVVRDPARRGRLLTSEDSSVALAKLQSTMSLLDKPPASQFESTTLHHLLVELKEVAGNRLHSPILVTYLCSRSLQGSLMIMTEPMILDISSAKTFEEGTTSGQLKTLFCDLTAMDIGQTPGFEKELYLIVKVYSNQALEPDPQALAHKESVDSTTSSLARSNENIAPISTSIKRGRQSLLWAQKQIGSTRRRGPIESTRPPSSKRNASPSIPDKARPNDSQNVQSVTEQGLQYVRRITGVGVLDIKSFVGQDLCGEQKMPLWALSVSDDGVQPSASSPDSVINDLINRQNVHSERHKAIDHIRLSLQSFPGQDPEEVVAKTPTVLQDISRTSKMGFSGAPTKPRSDIYLTLSEANLPSKALLSHPERGSMTIPANSDFRNLHLTLEVRTRGGRTVENCIFPSSNSPGLTAWQTVAVQRGESWNQVVRLVLPDKDVSEAHLIMKIANAPEVPFALCWIPLWDQGAFLRDGKHTPLLYLYDNITSKSYLALPWNSRAKDNTSKDEMLTGPVATLNLRTFLCSTELSQDRVLIELLKWRDQSEDHLLSLVRQITFVPEIEIVKMVNDVLDALFGILVRNTDKEEVEDLVLGSLITVLGIVHDRRFNLGPLVDKYIETRFDYPFATPCLIRGLLRLLSRSSDPLSSRRLHAAFKVGRQLFKFIVAARRKQRSKEAAIGVSNDLSFHGDFKSVFTSLESVMKDPAPSLVGSKTMIVQHIHTWLPDADDIFSEDETFQIVSSFIESCSDVQGKLVLYKLVLIIHLSTRNVFSQDVIQRQFISRSARWMSPYWGENSTVSSPSQWRDQVRLCCSIVSTHVKEFGLEVSTHFLKIIQSYRDLQAASDRNKDKMVLEHLFPTTYPFPSSPTSPSDFDEALVELASLLADCQGDALSRNLENVGLNLSDTISATLEVISSILRGQAFPESWVSLHIHHHRSALQTLETIGEIMIARFLPTPEEAEDFNTELWSEFFVILLALVGSENLALETFAEQKRRAVWKIAGDVREQGASLLRRSWDAIGWDSSREDQRRYGLQALGGFQVQYVPSLVTPIVELCLSVHEGLRRTAVGILQTMIISEWTLNEDLSVIEAEMIDCLDHTFELKGIGDSITQRLFVNELLDLFETLARIPNDGLWQAVKGLVSTLDGLLDLLAGVHSTEVEETARIMHTLQLMEFLKDMRKESIFIRYVHQLAELQAQLHNYTEAGLALRMHADLYSWKATKVMPLRDPSFPEQTSFERKEQLHFEMIKYFEEGGAWECALESYRELANQYEQYQYDFAKLARTEHSMARIHDIIAKGERQQPRYFRVIYRGLGFPESLRDRQYIFEGGPDERQSVFVDRLRLQHPAAQIAPQGELDSLEGQYLQISSVSIYRDLNHPLYQQSRVSQSVREHVLASKPSKFAVTSKRHSPVSGVHDQWIEKTVFTTANEFPSILSRSEVVSVDRVELSPLQTAVERTARKTSEIAALQRRIIEGDESAFAALTESVISSVDPTSIASVAQYRQLLPSPRTSGSSSKSSMSGIQESLLQALENALKNSLIDHASTLRQALALFTSPPHINHQASLSRSLASTFAPEFAVLVPKVRPPSPQAPGYIPVSPSLPPSQGLSSDPPVAAQQLANGTTALPPTNTITNNENAALSPLTPRARSRLSLAFLKPQNNKLNGTGPELSSSTSKSTSALDGDSMSSLSRKSGQGGATPVIEDFQGSANNAQHHDSSGAGAGNSSILSRVISKSSVGAEKEKENERPVTAHSGKSSGRVRKRLSLLGMGVVGGGGGKSKGTATAGKGVGVVKEE